MKIVEHKGQFRITIPRDLILDKGWNTDTRILFVEGEDGRVFLKEIEEAKEENPS